MKYGFIYLWRDKKHNRYYIGCHWGTGDDGYVCSSTWMLQAYKKRPQDFKRRILERFEDRSKANEIEHRWLQMIKTNELKNKYYNLSNRRFGHWSLNNETRESVAKKCGDLKRGHRWTDTQKAKLKGRKVWNVGMKGRYTLTICDDDPRKNRPSWNAGLKTGPLSKEHRDKISAKMKGKPLSKEHRKKISAGKKEKSTWNSVQR